jgi:cation:H+ antiporter
MDLALQLAIFLIATAALVWAADGFVDAIERIGTALKLPHFLTGVLFVALGTSLPELVTGLIAVSKGDTDLLVGNVLGSNIANIFLGLGATVFVAGKDIKYQQNIFRVHFPILVIALLLAITMMYDGIVTRLEAGLLFAMFWVYLWFLYGHKDEEVPVLEGDTDFDTTTFSWKDVAIAFGALGVVLFASDFAVNSVINIATMVGISSAALAATLIAIGTSLPEMIVVYAAIKKSNIEIAIGNILGSNIFNIVLIMGLGGLVSPLEVSQTTITILVPFSLMALFVYWAISQTKEITRHEGLAMVLFYLFFVGKLYAWL